MSNANNATPHNDPNVSLPAAVRAQIAAAEEVQRQYYDEGGRQTHEVGEDDPEAGAPHQEEGEGGDNDKGKNPSEGTEGFSDDTGGEEPKPEKVTRRGKVDNGSEEQSIRSLTGRVNKAVEQNRALAAELSTSHRRIAELEAALAAARATRVETPPAPAEFTEEEIADYGPEFLNLVGRKASQMIAPVRAEFDRRIEELASAVSSSTQREQMRDRQHLIESMDDKLPGWRDQNSDPEFLAWLDMPDIMSGEIRKTLLTNAFNSLNLPRVVAIFKGYKEAAPAPADQAPRTQAPTGKVDLASLAAPGRAKSGQAASPPDKPIITRAEIAQFYADAARGVISPEEMAKQEAILQEAMREGRVK